MCDEEGRLTKGVRAPEQSEISPIRYAISAGLLQNRINGTARGQKRPSKQLNYEIIYSKIIACTLSPRHEQLQIDNGALEAKAGDLDKFVTWSDNPGLVLSYLDATNFPEGKLARKFTLCDNFFHSAYGGSFLNHQWLIAANTPLWTAPIPADWQSTWDPVAKILNDNQLSFDGVYAKHHSAIAGSILTGDADNETTPH